MTYKKYRAYIAYWFRMMCIHPHLFKIAKAGQDQYGRFSRKQWQRIKRSQKHV